jgi:hypothetical protein
MVNPVGKPDAVAPHVRFDEQGWETESWQTGLRRCHERDASSHRKPNATAPVLDSTIPLPVRNRKGYGTLGGTLILDARKPDRVYLA